MVQFRKSKKIGPIRVTASKSGISTSAGVKGARVSLGADGKVRRTVGIPGSGVYDTKVIGQTGSKSAKAGRSKTTGSEPPATTVPGTPPAWLAEILARPSDAPPASIHQRAYVAVELKNTVANKHLKPMRLDHAVAILQHLGSDPTGLRKQNRDGLGGKDTKARKAWWKAQGL